MKAFLSLGSNKLDRAENLNTALRYLAEQMSILNTSSIYQSKAWGNTDQDDFYNMVIEVDTEMDAASLMTGLLNIETSMGRERLVKWEPRIIDIDILFYENEQWNEADLIIPHPYLHERNFVLVPMMEISSAYIHPVLGKSILELSKECKDELPLHKLHKINS